ncbi:hypothetical protein AB205_0012280 [Aquarana catesbeiana]|uniref:Uncharacterized protein n=1 Tax=Aquarana catesbeiana TaxID=8400 RepID=A0A2G9S2D8_AQUCT|nr:hypothetical protein AB205_0012280 [Aquarana catesbeiana]
MNHKLDDLQSKDHRFGLMVAGMLKKFPRSINTK